MPEKKWIFDTVALSNFLLSDSISILEERYGNRGMITWEVYDEISAGIMEYPQLKQIDRLTGPKIFKLITLSETEHDQFLELIGHLGKGEAACIAAAKERQAIVATDDRAARGQCSLMNIPFTGTIGILKAAFHEGQISLFQADDILGKMIKAGFYSPIRSISDIV